VANKQPIAGWFCHDECTSLREAPRAAGQGCSSGAARFFARRNQEHHTGRPRHLVSQRAARDHERRNSTFHVGGAAAIESAVSNLTSQRVDGPRLRSERHGIEVPGETERQFFRGAAAARDELGPSFTERYEVNGETRIFEQGRQPFGARTLCAGRIDRLEPDEFARQFD
jgi:hypothetical protein